MYQWTLVGRTRRGSGHEGCAFPGAARTCRHLFVCRKLYWEKRGRLFPSAARWGGVAGRQGGAVLVFKVDYFVFLVVFDY